MANPYLFWKALHVVGAVLMVGNVTVTGVWTILLWRHRYEVPLRRIAHGILWTDLWFTFGGGALMTIAGIQMVRITPALRATWTEPGWLRTGILLLAASSLVWLVALLPDQFRMDRCPADDAARFRTLYLRWSVVGWLATALLFAGVWVMVVKPA